MVSGERRVQYMYILYIDVGTGCIAMRKSEVDRFGIIYEKRCAL